MAKYLMRCGCVAQATDMKTGKPVCAIHIGIRPGADEIVREVQGNEELKGRTAKCAYGDTTVPSSWDLAFFEHHPDREQDTYYCGCWGWD